MLRVKYDNLLGEGDLVIATDPVTGIQGHDETLALETAVILSLLLDAPARDGDDVPAGAPQRGFWGDAYPLVTGDVWGSRLWLLERGKVNTETLLQAREICAQALQWMIDDGVAESIEIQNSWLLGRPGYMRILVGVQRPEDLAPSLFGPWDVYYGEV